MGHRSSPDLVSLAVYLLLLSYAVLPAAARPFRHDGGLVAVDSTQLPDDVDAADIGKGDEHLTSTDGTTS
jgi:hypothetical protein